MSPSKCPLLSSAILFVVLIQTHWHPAGAIAYEAYAGLPLQGVSSSDGISGNGGNQAESSDGMAEAALKSKSKNIRKAPVAPPRWKKIGEKIKKIEKLKVLLPLN